MASDYQTTTYWFDMAEYDLVTAKAMLKARYPSAKEKLEASLTLERCKDIIRGTEALALWIKMKS